MTGFCALSGVFIMTLPIPGGFILKQKIINLKQEQFQSTDITRSDLCRSLY